MSLALLAAPARAADAPVDPVAERWSGRSETSDVIGRAEGARKSSQWVEAVRLALIARAKGASAERADKVLRDVAPHLSMAQAACLEAWFGRRAELEFRFARAALDAGRRPEARSQALALLARDPSAKEVASLLQKSGGVPATDSVRVAPGATQSVFHVALLVPQSGDYEAYGRSLIAGLEIALAEHHAHSPLPVRLTVHETEGEGWRAASEGRAALRDGAGILVGDVLTIPTLVLAGLSSEAGIPLLSPSATEQDIGRASPILFQTGASAEAQARVLARYAVRDGKRATIAAPANLSAGFLDTFEAEVKRLGGSVVRVPAASGLRDFRPAGAEIRRAQATAVLLPLDPAEAELWVAGLAREKLLMPLLATEAVDPEGFHVETRKFLEGMAAVSLDYALPEAVFARVDTLAHQHYSIAADRFVRRGYLTGRVIAAALASGADSPSAFAAALRRRSGGLGFVRYEDAEATLPILTVRKGQFVRIH